MYHVMTHAVANSWLFVEEGDYRTRLALFADTVHKGTARLHSYCLMGNHEHLLLSVEDDMLANVMQRMNRAYAGDFNRAHARRGRLYREPYQSVPVLTERHLLELIRYLALNPEIIGWGRAESYPWSSYPSLIGVCRELSFVDSSPLFDAVGGGRQARRRIVSLVDDGRLRKRQAA